MDKCFFVFFQEILFGDIIIDILHALQQMLEDQLRLL